MSFAVALYFVRTVNTIIIRDRLSFSNDGGGGRIVRVLVATGVARHASNRCWCCCRCRRGRDHRRP
jgi:hypothetical protein